ncbi:MAG: alpha/beta fold hydrolase [Burkholderiales bacterium]
MHRVPVFMAVWLALAGGCARLPDTGVSNIEPETLSHLQEHLLSQKADLAQFRMRGPYAVSELADYEIRLSTTESINADLFLASHADRAPLVILLHGYGNSKEDHTYQAIHLASWGMHCLTLQLPNSGPAWVGNGRTLVKLVNFISRWPEIIDGRVDLRKIILVGHSFGGSSVAVALAEGAPAIGGILLDPAAIGRDMPVYLSKINKPVLLLGADERVFSARDRDFFYRFIASDFAEVSIKDAAHEDAQFPSRFAPATSDLQVTFVSAITAAALSLSSTGRFDNAWSGFGIGLNNGRFVDAKKK